MKGRVSFIIGIISLAPCRVRRATREGDLSEVRMSAERLRWLAPHVQK
jgi:hypothetical protein